MQYDDGQNPYAPPVAETTREDADDVEIPATRGTRWLARLIDTMPNMVSVGRFGRREVMKHLLHELVEPIVHERNSLLSLSNGERKELLFANRQPGRRLRAERPAPMSRVVAQQRCP